MLSADELAQVMGAIDEKIGRAIATMTPRLVPGSAQASIPPSQVNVLIDGDPDGSYTGCDNITGRTISPNARVMVLFVPPNGAFVIGVVGNAQILPTGWSASTVTELRTLDGDTASLTEARESLATLIIDLKAAGVIGG